MPRSASRPLRLELGSRPVGLGKEIDVDALITVDSLCKRFGGLAAVDGVSFELAEGQTLALLGPSGCGKTTLLRAIAGLERPQAGAIAIGGRAVFDAALGTDL